MPQKTLLLVFHPDLEHSRGNARLLEAVKTVPELSYRDMYLEYDGTYIDGATEQIFLEEYDLIVVQHPMYWFSAPAMLAEWMERSLTRGFAWPPGDGDALAGKGWRSVVTTAAGAADFTDAPGSASVETLLKPYEMSATFCGMRWLPPFVLHDVRDPAEGGLSDEALDTAATQYRALLEGEATID